MILPLSLLQEEVRDDSRISRLKPIMEDNLNTLNFSIEFIKMNIITNKRSNEKFMVDWSISETNDELQTLDTYSCKNSLVLACNPSSI